jgi:hypothetical protein
MSARLVVDTHSIREQGVEIKGNESTRNVPIQINSALLKGLSKSVFQTEDFDTPFVSEIQSASRTDKPTT